MRRAGRDAAEAAAAAAAATAREEAGSVRAALETRLGLAEGRAEELVRAAVGAWRCRCQCCGEGEGDGDLDGQQRCAAVTDLAASVEELAASHSARLDALGKAVHAFAAVLNVVVAGKGGEG